MNLQLPQRLDKATFLDWAERQEGRYELVEGRVVEMTLPLRAHAMVVMNLAGALKARLDPRQWTVLADFGLDVGPDTFRVPDIVVDRAAAAPDDRWALAPVLLAEVLSSSTAHVDLGDKAAEYLALTGLQAYLVFAQDQRKAWMWIRGTDDRFPPGPQVIGGTDAIIRVPRLALDLPLAEAYAGLPGGSA